ncbi:uncharacterized protein LOC106172126 [Lingula anatina]|uniref:Uncharacterized protein LOC106172126 n=1 Tax=Lingula anatina TaxID=7574 RepID=A0A1S3JE65_LINAN|nr:uncharacterized protein LOC106172126 [Lingula anatina]|eukprot:XP_013408179.1 uncharacterized protein LOC106172126 [Lingula anatina]
MGSEDDSAKRNEVFRSKVLKTIYPKGGGTDPVLSDSDEDIHVPTQIQILQPKKSKIYTVTPPPEGFDHEDATHVMQQDSESLDNASGSEGDGTTQYKRRKRKRHGKPFHAREQPVVSTAEGMDPASPTKTNCGNKVDSNKSDACKDSNLDDDLKSTTRIPNTHNLTKNQKRKLKKKRRKEKVKGKELDVLSKDFTYDSERHQVKCEELQREKMLVCRESLKEFLSNLWEVYSSEVQIQSDTTTYCKFKDPVTKFLQSIDETLLSDSDVSYLDRIKTVLLLKDRERFGLLMKDWREHSKVEIEFVHAVCKLSEYWLSSVVTS